MAGGSQIIIDDQGITIKTNGQVVFKAGQHLFQPGEAVLVPKTVLPQGATDYSNQFQYDFVSNFDQQNTLGDAQTQLDQPSSQQSPQPTNHQAIQQTSQLTPQLSCKQQSPTHYVLDRTSGELLATGQGITGQGVSTARVYREGTQQLLGILCLGETLTVQQQLEDSQQGCEDPLLAQALLKYEKGE